ncbi:MAG: hypothetical protein PHX15_01875 [Candidatus Nanoarchaeia archaeon]|jgi:hypothetical protein|nr:hypothetical protein [Candidatus Nanoarchaeia archaeon]MDD3993923.1 hypothetical protein [Candidatus Nanoarchaeia archaeon]MDD4563387.1 hypothetical protein [Candidatus Nanoarchaeia archaeon]
MKIYLKEKFDPEEDPELEVSKLDQFRKLLYGTGIWKRSKQGGYEIIL